MTKMNSFNCIQKLWRDVSGIATVDTGIGLLVSLYTWNAIQNKQYNLNMNEADLMI